MFWGFIASMYVGNLMLLALNLPLVGLFVSVLRIPYAYLYPLIIMFCIIGVYEVSHSIVDVWIMLIMGVVGYGLRKFDFDPAPLVLGLVIAPTFELSLRQSLVMSGGDWSIFFNRPIAATLFAISGVLLALSALSSSPAKTGAASSPRWRRSAKTVTTDIVSRETIQCSALTLMLPVPRVCYATSRACAISRPVAARTASAGSVTTASVSPPSVTNSTS